MRIGVLGAAPAVPNNTLASTAARAVRLLIFMVNLSCPGPAREPMSAPSNLGKQLYQRPIEKEPAIAPKPAIFLVHKHMRISVQPNCRLNSRAP
jgi:hypothetical protein